MNPSSSPIAIGEVPRRGDGVKCWKNQPILPIARLSSPHRHASAALQRATSPLQRGRVKNAPNSSPIVIGEVPRRGGWGEVVEVPANIANSPTVFSPHRHASAALQRATSPLQRGRVKNAPNSSPIAIGEVPRRGDGVKWWKNRQTSQIARPSSPHRHASATLQRATSPLQRGRVKNAPNSSPIAIGEVPRRGDGVKWWKYQPTSQIALPSFHPIVTLPLRYSAPLPLF